MAEMTARAGQNVAASPRLTPSGLERRLKRRLLKTTQEFLAITTPRLEPALDAEIRSLPHVTGTRTICGGVEFRGPLDTVYRAALRLGTANRLLMRIDTFMAKSYPELFNKARRIHWELFTGFAKNVAIDATSRSSRLHHTGNIVETVHSALADRMGRLGVPVTLKNDGDGPRFAVRMAADTCTISADASGALFYKRGYRRETGHAPLRESVAAALLILAKWKEFGVIADPLCGSGTFVIEAASLARNIPPGRNRTFAFFTWPSFDKAAWERAKHEAAGAEKATAPIRFLASDISGEAVTAAKNNARRAGVENDIVFRCADCFDFDPGGNAGLIIANLPYGKRATAAGGGLVEFYRRWGEHVRRRCRGWTFAFLSADRSFARHAGLSVHSELRFENGGIPVWFVTGTVF